MQKETSGLIESFTRLARMIHIKEFCPFASENDYVEMTTWTNGEGADFIVLRHGQADTIFSLTYGEMDALKALWR